MLLLTLWAAVVAVELESDKKKNQDKVFPIADYFVIDYSIFPNRPLAYATMQCESYSFPVQTRYTSHRQVFRS